MASDGGEMKGSAAIARALAATGIDTLFTVPGGHFLPTYHEIGRLGSPKLVAARHEQGAAYMASGYALTRGTPGVVFTGAPGPGASNLITSVANAQADSIPLLVITAQVDRRYVHRNVLQYCDNVALLDPFTKSSLQANSVAELPSLLATGLQLAAAGRPGPVHIAIPQDLQAEAVTSLPEVPVASLLATRPAGSDIAQASELLAGSSRPAILAGHGVIRGRGTAALQRLAEQLGAPVATSRSGVGSIATGHPAAVGMLGFYGPVSARDAVAGADLVLIAGCAMGEQTTYGWRPDLIAADATVIQVDIDASQINRAYEVDLGIVADASATLAALAEASAGSRDPWFTDEPHRHPPQNDPAQGASAVTIIQAVNRHAPAGTLVSADIGNHRLWVCEQLDVSRPEGLLQSCEFDAMGFSLPAAIGAAVGEPGTRVVAIAGDGGFVHTLGELVVAGELGVPVAAIVFVDGALGILKHQAEEMYGEDHFVRLAPIDFEGVARSFGIEARTARTDAEVDEAIEWAIGADGPVLVQVVVDPDEIFPPLRTKIEQRKRDLVAPAD